MIPDDLPCFCFLCLHMETGIEAIAKHVEHDHGLEAQRWPDGRVVVEAFEFPEL